MIAGRMIALFAARPPHAPAAPARRYSDLGRREDSLQATKEAVDLYRKLEQAQPDAILPDLAKSLHNLGIRLSDVGDPDDALQATREAVDILRELVKRWQHLQPELDESLSQLAELQNQARLRGAP